jgi:Carboxypeptidase regulatory-like domain/TonB-dependent Receptor Plug Domain
MRSLRSSVCRVGVVLLGRAIYPLSILCLFLGVFVSLAQAQEATIVGTVTDSTGAAVANAAVKITNIDTGIIRTVNTSSDGQYVAPDLHIGRYTVRVQASGFKADQRSDIVLQVGDRSRINFSLSVGSAQETITVEANAVAVQTDTGEVSSVITGQQITQLATNGRSVFALESLVPGASSVQSDFQVPTSAGGDFNVSFNGQRVSHNLWLVDGGEAADRGGGGGAIVLPSMDAIAEFRTLTSNYSAEYGLSSAGTISLVIKSGSKQLHAGAWYFGRNDALDARNYFNPAPQKVAELRFHDFGFNVGGPVSFHPSSSNPKTFFFYNMEWRRYIAGGLLNQTVPLASEYPDAGGAGTGATFSTAITVPDVTGFAPNCPAGLLAPGKPFPKNTIPDCAIDANAKALLSAGIFPKPTSGTQFQGGNNSPTYGTEEIVRIDHQFNDKFSVFGHFIADQASQTYGTTQWSNDNVPTVFNTFGNPSYSYTIHAVNTIKPTLLNEAAFSYDGNRIHILPAGVYAAPSDFTFNRIFSGENVDNRIPTIQLSGSTGATYNVNWLPWNNTADDYQIRDDLSWSKGPHQLKFGGSWALYKKVQDYFANTQGQFGFNGQYTGSDFADLLVGYSNNYQESGYKGTGHWNALSLAAYVQDNWRATSRLTLNLGLRWDGIPHTYESNNNMANFYPNLYDPTKRPIFVPGSNDSQIASNSPGLGTSPVPALAGYQFYLNGIGLEGKNGVPKGLVNDTWDAFGPRLGFAYDLTGRGQTVIRGGFGSMFERIQGNDMYNAATNSPFGYNLNTGGTGVLLANPHDQVGGGTITVPILTSSITGLNQHYKVPTTYSYSVGVQQAIGKNAVFSASYVGNQSRYQSYFQETNLPPQSQLGALQAGTSATPFNGLVPYLGFSSIKLAFTGQNGHYNSLQTELHGHVTKDLYLQAAYTLSRAIDPSTGNGGNGFDLDTTYNPYAGWKYDVGPGLFDRTHIFFANFVYDIPLLRNSSNRLLKTGLGGWQLSGIVTEESGAPLNINCTGGCYSPGSVYDPTSSSFDASLNPQKIKNTVASLFSGDATVRPDRITSVSYPKKVNQWFSTAAFAPTGTAANSGVLVPGLWGNLPYGAVRAPGRNNWNLALFKQFILRALIRGITRSSEAPVKEDRALVRA